MAKIYSASKYLAKIWPKSTQLANIWLKALIFGENLVKIAYQDPYLAN